MKILLINKFLYPKGGDAISTLATGDLLRRNGHEVEFWGMLHPLNPSYTYADHFVAFKDYYSHMSISQKLHEATDIIYSFEAQRKIERVIRIFQPDMVHLNNFAHQISPSILMTLSKFQIPSVMTMRDYKMVCPTYSMLLNGKPCELCKNDAYFHCFLEKCNKGSTLKSAINTVEMYLHHTIFDIYNKINTYISPSLFMLNKIKELGFNKKVVHLRNFVHSTNMRSYAESPGSYILFIGRLSEEKGLFTLLDAMKDTKIPIKIIGDGPIKKSLEAKAEKESLNNAEFLGYQSGEPLEKLIANCAFSVITSECYENNPRSVIESFAYGKPAIGSRIGGIPELVIDNETGFTYEPCNSKDLREKITYLYNKPKLIVSLGKNARTFVERECNADIHYEKLMNIYRTAMEKSAT